MILKGNKDRIEIEGYPVIKEYQYLGITINDKMEKNKIFKIIFSIKNKKNLN